MKMTNSDYLLVLTIAFISTAAVTAEECVPMQVIRRPDYDTVLYLDGHEHNCSQNFSTYLVDERMCVSNQDLLNGCEYAFTGQGEDTHTVYINTHNQNDSFTISDTSSSTQASAILSFGDETTGLSNFNCDIDNLEVYRGRQKAVEIDHKGFTITAHGKVEINSSILVYDIDEFDGELFRMNLSCSTQGSGCLWFKVVGETNLTLSKFNGAVSHLQPTSKQPDAITTDGPGVDGKITVQDIITYAILGLAGFTSLLFVISVCCTMFVCCAQWVRKKRQDKKAARIPRRLRGELDVSQIVSSEF